MMAWGRKYLCRVEKKAEIQVENMRRPNLAASPTFKA
jgi:hypothetical protein